MPGLGFLRKYGTVAATPENAEQALDVGRRAARLPGRRLRGAPPDLGLGEGRLRRPQGLHPARARAQGRADRPGRLDRRPGDRALPLAAASASRSCSGLDRMFRLKVLPISLALPWGLNVGDMLGHFPLPAKITIQVLEPIDLRGAWTSDRGLRARARPRCRPRSPRSQAERALPGDRLMRGRARHHDRRPPREIWELVTDPTSTRASGRHHALDAQERRGTARRALPDAHARRLGRDRRPDRGRRVRRARATSPGPASPGSTSAAAGGCARRRTGARR